MFVKVMPKILVVPFFPDTVHIYSTLFITAEVIAKNDNKQTANKQRKPNTDTTMTKLPVTHIYSTNIRQTVLNNKLLSAQADLGAG